MSFYPACSSYQRYLWKDICQAVSTIRHSRTLPWCYTSISNGMDESRKNWESHLSLGRIHMKASRIVTIPTAQQWLNNSWCVCINADKGFLLVIASSLWLLVCFPSRLVQWSIIHDSAALPSDIKQWNAWIHLDPSHCHFHSTSSDMAIHYGNIIKRY